MMMMMIGPFIIKPPFSIWVQLSSLCFAMSGNFSDLLIIRLCLSTAYVFSFLNSLFGGPLWPNTIVPYHIQLDSLCWGLFNLYVHCTTVFRLLHDEQQVILTADEQALWRLFYRTGGLSQKMFQTHISQYCQTVVHARDSCLDAEKYFYIVYFGIVKLTVRDENGTIVSSREATSGQIFDFRAMGILEEDSTWSQYRLEAVAVGTGPVKLFRFYREQIEKIASDPVTRLMWKEILMENLLRIIQRHYGDKAQPRFRSLSVNNLLAYANSSSSGGGGGGASSSNLNDVTNHTGTLSNSIRSGIDGSSNTIYSGFAPLEEWEEPHPLRAGSTQALLYPFSHIFAYMRWSFAPPWPFAGPPEGLRHDQLLVGTGTRFGRVQSIHSKRFLINSPGSSTKAPSLDKSAMFPTSLADISKLLAPRSHYDFQLIRNKGSYDSNSNNHIGYFSSNSNSSNNTHDESTASFQPDIGDSNFYDEEMGEFHGAGLKRLNNSTKYGTSLSSSFTDKHNILF